MITPIIDRNLLDITYAKNVVGKVMDSGYDSLTADEKMQWEAGLKGFLNYTDLNRIESNTQEVARMVGVQIYTPKTNWTMMDIPTQRDFQRIRDNVQKIRSSNYVHSDTPITPELPLNHYEKINDLEKIVFDVYDMYTRNMSAIYYVGELYDEEELFELMNLKNIDYIDEVYTDEKIGVM